MEELCDENGASLKSADALVAKCLGAVVGMVYGSLCAQKTLDKNLTDDNLNWDFLCVCMGNTGL